MPEGGECRRGPRISFTIYVRNEPTPLRKNSRSTTIVVLFGLLTAKYGTVNVQKGNGVAFLEYLRELCSFQELQV